MKKNTEIDDVVFDLWDKGLSYKELARLKFSSFLSLKTIRNIVWYYKKSGDKSRYANSAHAKAIYDLFRIKFLELQDVNRATCFVFENQPDFSVSEITIRRIINKKLNERQGAHTKSHPVPQVQ